MFMRTANILLLLAAVAYAVVIDKRAAPGILYISLLFEIKFS